MYCLLNAGEVEWRQGGGGNEHGDFVWNKGMQRAEFLIHLTELLLAPQANDVSFIDDKGANLLRKRWVTDERPEVFVKKTHLR